MGDRDTKPEDTHEALADLERIKGVFWMCSLAIAVDPRVRYHDLHLVLGLQRSWVKA